MKNNAGSGASMTRGVVLKTAILVLVLVTGTGAEAQSSPPAPDEQARARTEALERSSILLQRFARCFVNDHPRAAAAIVDPNVETSVEARDALLTRYQDELDRCLSISLGRHHLGGMLISAQLGVGRPVLIGAFAEQLYLRRHRRLPVIGPPNLPPMKNSDQLPLHTTYAFANCLIEHDPDSVDRLLRTRVVTSEEDDAFAALSAHYGPCLDAGTQLSLNRITLRTALADQLYRRTGDWRIIGGRSQPEDGPD